MNRSIRNALLLGAGGLLIFAGGLAVGRWWERGMASSPASPLANGEQSLASAPLSDPKEEVDKAWIYPSAFTPGKASLVFRRGNGVQSHLDHPTAGRTLCYYYTVPEDFEKVVAFYDDRIAAVYNVPAQDRLTLPAKEGLRAGFSGARSCEYTWFVEPEQLPAAGAAVAATLSVRSPSHSLSVFIRKRASDKPPTTVVTLIYDPPMPGK